MSRIGKHALNGKLHCKIALFLHKRAVFYLFQVTDVAGVVLIKLFIELIACENGFVCIDNDYEIAAVNAGCEESLVLSAKKNGCFGGNSAERLALRVNNIPFAFDLVSLWHKC